MKLHFIFFLGGEASTTEGASVGVSEEITPEIDVSWKNPDAFKLPNEINLRTERANLKRLSRREMDGKSVRTMIIVSSAKATG